MIGYTLDWKRTYHDYQIWVEAFQQSAKSGILVQSTANSGKPISTGASKIGGLADLHPDTEWLEGENGPAAFVAQWNLDELAVSPTCRILPRTGLLSFFIDLIPFVEGSGDGITKVIYTPSLDDLEEREPDEERHEENVLRECWVMFREWLTIPHASSPVLKKRRLPSSVPLHPDQCHLHLKALCQYRLKKSKRTCECSKIDLFRQTVRDVKPRNSQSIIRLTSASSEELV